MLTGDSHQTAIAVARGVGMLPPGSQLVIIQARSELHSTAQPPSHMDAPAASDSSHSLRLPVYPVVTTSKASGKPDGQKAGSSQVSGSNFAGSVGGRHPSFTNMCGTNTADSAVSYDPVAPFGTAQEPPLLKESSQQHLCQQRSSLEQSCQQVLSQQPSAHQQSHQLKKLSENNSSVSTLDTAQPVCLQQDTDQVVQGVQHSSCRNLVFTLQSTEDEEEIDAQRAITSLAQVDCSVHTLSDVWCNAALHHTSALCTFAALHDCSA